MPKFIAELGRGRILGHPIHSMLVHFPSALFPISWLFDFIAWYLNDTYLANMAFYLLGLAVLSAMAALIFGAIDYFAMATQTKAWKIASIHALLNILWIIIFGTIWGVEAMQFHDIRISGITLLMIKGITVLGMIISNYLGAELVYRYHVGSKSNDS